MKHLETPAGRVPLPAFFPDATYGAIRAGSFEDVYRGGLFGCEMNSYHLMTKPGAKLVKSLGGLHGFTGYRGAILTDSGGFQLYSLIRENADYGEIRDKEIIFRPDRGKEKLTFTPEKCIQVQFQYGSDVMMALDMCTHPDAGRTGRGHGAALFRMDGGPSARGPRRRRAHRRRKRTVLHFEGELTCPSSSWSPRPSAT